MKDELKIEIARMAMDLTLALLSDNKGHLANLMHEGKIPKGASPMAIFDEVYSHLLISLEPVRK